MAAAPRQEQHSHIAFPPSPPPSPPMARRRHRKKDSLDPFLQLGPPANSTLGELSTSSPPSEGDLLEEPLYKRIILTPFLFTSFLISLFLIDIRNTVSRTKTSSLFSFLDPEPYQDPSDSRWDRRGSTTHVQPPDALNPGQRSSTEKKKRRSWHLRGKIRKIAKLEISDAFEMRGRVMVAMVVTLMMALYAVWYSLSRMMSIL